MKIEVKNKQIFVDDRKWSKLKTGQDLGDQIINVLFYCNQDGEKNYKLIVNGKNETAEFKKEVKEKYENIPNTDLRDRFFKYCRV